MDSTTNHGHKGHPSLSTPRPMHGGPHHADLMGGQTRGVQPLRGWTVSFAHGGVVEWTE